MVNKKIFVLIFASVFFLMGNISAFAGGDGTSNNPYQISTCSWLQDIGDNSSTLSAKYILINDIDCSDTINWNTGSGFSPIGFPAIFTGNFDGNNHTINKLYSNHPGFLNSGLFAFTSSNVIIKNVGLIDVNIVGAAQDVGGLTLQNTGLISNSYVSGGVIEGTSFVGGLAYENSGTISNSYSNVSIVGSAKYAGGLVATNFGTISNSYALGNVSTNDQSYGYSSRIGGLVGTNSGAIYSSYSAGKIVVPNWQGTVGGLVSYSSGSCTSSFWDIQTSGKTTSACGTGKTTAQMKTPVTFKTPPSSNWDFTNIWNMSKQNGYPCLRWDHNCIPVPIYYWTTDSTGQIKILASQIITAPTPTQKVYLVLENPYGTSGNWKFNIYEKDSSSDEAIRTGADKLTGTLSGDKIIAEWEITQADINKDTTEDPDNNFEFYFIATVDSYTYLQSPILNLEWQTGGPSTPTCSDGIKNQGETGIDCGGPCDDCNGDSCTDDNDCQSGNCVDDVCVECENDNDCSQGETCVNNICGVPGGVDCPQYNLCLQIINQNDCNSCQVSSLDGCSWNGTSCNAYENLLDSNGISIGTCEYQENTDDTCEDDGMLKYSLITLTTGCDDKEDISIFCSAQTSLPLENKFGILLTIISIIGIYFLFFRKKNE